MPDEPTPQATSTEPEGTTATQAAGGKPPDTPADSAPEPTIPKSRFDEVNAKWQAAQAKLDSIEKANKKATEAQLADQAKWQELATQREQRIAALEPLEAELTAAREWAAQHAQTLMANWPAELLAMQPKDVDAFALLRWIDSAKELAQKLSTPNAPPGNSGGPKPSGTPSAVAQAEQEKARRAFARTVRGF